MTRSELGPPSPANIKARLPSYSTIFKGTRVPARKADQLASVGGSGECVQPHSTTTEGGGFFALAESDSVAVSGAGASANSVRLGWSGRHNRILQRWGFPRVSTYTASARILFGYGRLGDVRRAADFPVSIAGIRGKFAAFALRADIPALLRNSALGYSPRDIST